MDASRFFREFRGDLLTTEAVLTETVYLLRKEPEGRGACLDFFAHKGAHLVPLTPALLLRCKELMARYADLPMDFADATLVALSEETGIRRVATFDRRGFSVYRARGRPLDVSP